VTFKSIIRQQVSGLRAKIRRPFGEVDPGRQRAGDV